MVVPASVWDTLRRSQEVTVHFFQEGDFRETFPGQLAHLVHRKVDLTYQWELGVRGATQPVLLNDNEVFIFPHLRWEAEVGPAYVKAEQHGCLVVKTASASWEAYALCVNFSIEGKLHWEVRLLRLYDGKLIQRSLRNGVFDNYPGLTVKLRISCWQEYMLFQIKCERRQFSAHELATASRPLDPYRWADLHGLPYNATGTEEERVGIAVLGEEDIIPNHFTFSGIRLCALA